MSELHVWHGYGYIPTAIFSGNYPRWIRLWCYQISTERHGISILASASLLTRLSEVIKGHQNNKTGVSSEKKTMVFEEYVTTQKWKENEIRRHMRNKCDQLEFAYTGYKLWMNETQLKKPNNCVFFTSVNVTASDKESRWWSDLSNDQIGIGRRWIYSCGENRKNINTLEYEYDIYRKTITYFRPRPISFSCHSSTSAA